MALVDGEALALVLDLEYVADDDDGPGYDQVAAAADTIVSGLLTTGDDIDHTEHAQDREAALAVAAEMFQARTATGGQPVGIDFQPGAYRLSTYLTRRVSQLTATCADVSGWVG
jgi:hypothetical protein